MSERGSFVTEYVYCKRCFEAAKSVLLRREKALCSVVVPHWNSEHEGPEMPILAGKVGGLGAGDELLAFEFDFNESLAKVICHPMRIAVLAESGDRVFIVTPNVEVERRPEGASARRGKHDGCKTTSKPAEHGPRRRRRRD